MSEQLLYEGSALWTYKREVQKRSWLDWLRAHVSVSKPLHRYEGVLDVFRNGILLKGYDTQAGEERVFRINKAQIKQVYLGFDGTFHLGEVSGLGLHWQPLRIKYIDEEDKNERYLYLVMDFALGRSTNKLWYSALKDWLRK